MNKKLLFLLCFSMALLIFTGCNMPQKAVTPPTETPQEIAEDTPEPTETPTPLPQREKIAFVPSEEVPAVTDSLSKAKESLCAETYECQTATNEDAVDSDADFVIFAKEPTALEAIKERFSQTHFIVVSDPSAS